MSFRISLSRIETFRFCADKFVEHNIPVSILELGAALNVESLSAAYNLPSMWRYLARIQVRDWSKADVFASLIVEVKKLQEKNECHHE